MPPQWSTLYRLKTPVLEGPKKEDIFVAHLLVFEPLAMDEEVDVAGQLSRHHLTDAHPAEPPTLLCQPSTTRVISGHDHRFDAHNVTVTEREKEREKELHFDTRHMSETKSIIIRVTTTYLPKI